MPNLLKVILKGPVVSQIAPLLSIELIMVRAIIRETVIVDLQRITIEVQDRSHLEQ